MTNLLVTKTINTLPANTQGTDYILGDLHGCFQLLQDLLHKVNFDPTQDRLFSVGDLVDRGPDSLACLQLLKEPWFYAVLGNHELMLADFFAEYDLTANTPYDDLNCWFNTGDLGALNKQSVVNKRLFLNNGGDWIGSYYDLERQRMTMEFDAALARVYELPHILVVAEGKARFQIVHAELVNKTSAFFQAACRDEDIDRWLQGEAIPEQTMQRMLWGRTLFGSSKASKLAPVQKGLSRTYCGHTIDPSVRQVLSHLCLDTGAYMTQSANQKNTGAHCLTLYDAHKQQAIQMF